MQLDKRSRLVSIRVKPAVASALRCIQKIARQTSVSFTFCSAVLVLAEALEAHGNRRFSPAELLDLLTRCRRECGRSYYHKDARRLFSEGKVSNEAR